MAERSKVWTFFSKSEDSSHALCRLCSRKLVHKGGTTSNLIKHREHVHASQWTKENKGQKSSDTGDSATKSTTGPMDLFLREKTCPPWRSGHLTSAITNMIALDLRPVSLVNGIGFQKLMQVADQVSVFRPQPTWWAFWRKSTKKERFAWSGYLWMPMYPSPQTRGLAKRWKVMWQQRAIS